MQSLILAAIMVLDPVEAPEPDTEIMDECTITLPEEDGPVSCEPPGLSDDSDHTSIDDIVIGSGLNACWIRLEWCRHPNTGRPYCTCTGCALGRCVNGCWDLYRRTC